MISVTGFHSLEIIHQANDRFVCSAIRESDNRKVVLKFPDPDTVSPDQIARYHREYQTLSRINSNYIVKVYDILEQEGVPIVVEEHIDLKRLANRFNERLSIADATLLIENLARALDDIHGHNIVYRNISPENILVSDDFSEIRLVDFSLALFQNVALTPDPNNMLEGNIEYVSPEQTGRMNLPIDYRSDIYALGVLLFQALTGKLPFFSNDYLELVFQHIARMPDPPSASNSEVPSSLDKITLKLLAKSPDLRYQSHFAIISDLARARDLGQSLATGGSEFEVALDDVPERLFVPTKILGRDHALMEIRNLVGSTDHTGTQCLMIAGEAGTGKTTLLRESAKINIGASGLACITRLSHVSSDVPYSGFSALLSDLARQLLSQPDLKALRKNLAERCGSQSNLLLELAPGLNRLLPESGTRETAQSNPLESQKRLIQAFANFLSGLGATIKPIVLCIDDIHKMDDSSLDLLRASMAPDFCPGLVLLATFDPNQVDQSIGAPGAATLDLGNLEETDLQELLTESLYRSREEVDDLAAVIYAKTQGNPQAFREFLSELYTEGHLYFDREHREWNWNLDAAAQLAPTNNVGEVLARNLTQLDDQTAQTLKIAACIGDEFGMDTIKRVSGMTFSESSACLIRAVSEGFLLSRGLDESSRYMFAHDKIQQAAYAQLTGTERQAIHAAIGNTYLSRFKSGDRLFDVVNQLNNSVQDPNSDIENPVELAELNLRAGNKAKQAGAFQAAFRYLRTALALQGKNVWENYQLSLDIHLAGAEAAYFCGDRYQFDNLIAATIEHAKSAFDQSRAYEIQLRALVAYGEIDRAIEIGGQVLNALKLPVPDRVRRPYLTYWTVKTLVRFRLAAQSGKAMSDPNALAAMRILMILCQAGYLAGRPITAYYSIKMIEISLEYGLAPETSFAYPMFGALVIRYFGTVSTGYGFAQLAMNNLDPNNSEMHCRTSVVIHNFISFWKHHLKDTLAPLAEAEQAGFEWGDVEFAQVAGTSRCVNGFILGQDLNILDTSFEQKNARADELNQTPMLTLGLIFQQGVKNLLVNNPEPWVLRGSLYDEDECLPIHTSNRDYTSLTNLYVVKTLLAVLFREHEAALDFSKAARRSLDTLVSSPLVPFFTLLESLACIKQLRDAPALELWKLRMRIQLNLRSLRKWSQHAPMNNAHAYHLAQAELAAANHLPTLATDHYEAAMTLAKKNGHTHVLGLIQELTGRFFEKQEKHSLSVFYLRRARASYVRWGANAKVVALDKEFSELTDDRDFAHLPKRQDITEYPATAERLSDSYFDLNSVIKASQVLSGEIILEILLEKLMQVALENAGAHSASLVLADNDDLFVEIYSRYSGSNTEHSVTRERLANSQLLPVSIIQYVARTEEDLVLNDAVNEDMFAQDQYIATSGPRSILCFPILSKSHLTGVLYLENLQNTHAFSQDRVAVLKLLASQAAIAIENAKLYRQLSESKNKYLALYENAVEGIFEVNMQGELLSLNPAAAQLIGHSSWVDGETRQVDFSQFFVDPDELRQFTRRLLEDKRVVGFESKLKRFNQEEIWVAMSAHLIVDEAGDPSRVEGSIIEITERKLRQQAEHATKLAEAATQTKSQFLANMSHEIRTPMNAILGYTKLALRDTENEQQLNYLQTIKSSTDHLLRVVNDILDISKIESGKLELQHKPFSLNGVLQDIEQLFALEARAKGLRLVMPTATGHYIGDPVRLGQVLINLIGNAIKFTREGSVSVELSALPLHDGTHSLNFVVADTGEGIKASELDNIFEAFTQTNSSTNESGTGLGLAISRSIVQKMDGHIHASSVPGSGSKFYFTVVLEPTAAALEPDAREHADNHSEGNQAVLLVEDNQINRDLAAEVLRAAGYEVLLAGDGQEALDTLNHHDVLAVLMDQRMPRMSGNEAIKIIRQREDLKHLNVIALSAGVLQHEIDEALMNGFDHYITKPVDFDNLLRLLATLGGRAEPARVSIKKPAALKLTIRDVDFGLALRNHDDDEELLDRLTHDFKDIYGDAAQQLEVALAQEKTEVAERLLHNIAGVAGSFGAETLMAYTRKLERVIQTHGNLRAHHVERFRDEVENFLLALEEFHTTDTHYASRA